MIDKIYQLKIYGSFILRANVYFDIDNPLKIKEIFKFCMNARIQLTFCIDIKSSTSDLPDSKDILNMLNQDPIHWNVSEHVNHMTFKNNEYIFWVFHHKENYKNDNYIILPSGELTCNFKNVIDCRGGI
jgi:hypothetical protein